VVARRSDALTDYVTVVEAKSWSNRVGKEVVAKLAYVLADVGMHKGIIAAPGGSPRVRSPPPRRWASRFGTAPSWNDASVPPRWPTLPTAEGSHGSRQPDRNRRPPSNLAGTGHERAEANGSGTVGMGGDSLVWQAALWLPVRAIAFRVADAGVQGRRHGSGHHPAGRQGNGGVGPGQHGSGSGAPSRHPARLGAARRGRVDHRRARRAVARTHASLSRGDEQRAVVIDGRTGAAVSEYSHALTANFGAFRDRLS
jgi:hypothetical protein